ncbi:MAG: HlyC/CorC family transporter [Candidatus Latescibacterota bacterium]|nr:MAG: HlyC/CorC family transporter [Candidatus Latescibacterota bacterium]
MLILRLVLLVLLLGLSGYFSSSESALFSLRAPQLQRLRQRATRASRAVLTLLQRPRTLLATVLIGNTLVNVLLSVVAAGLFVAWLGAERGPVVATFVMTVVLLVFGEITPKTVAVARPLGVSRLVAPSLTLFQRLLWPLSAMAVRLTDALARALERRIPPRDEVLTEQEIKMLVTMGWEQGVVGVREKEFIHNVFQLNDRLVKEIVTPRTQVFAADADASVDDLREAIGAAGYSRVPLYEGSHENIVGYVEVSDLLWGDAARDPRRMRDLSRELHFYPETLRVGALLLDMRRRGAEIAAVVDEHGSFDGIVSLEDAVEQVVGKIMDLHDIERARFTNLGDGEVLVGAQMEIEVFNELLGAELHAPEMETVGGFVIYSLGRIPAVGDTVESGGLLLTVEEALPNRILKLRVRHAGGRRTSGGER